MSGYLLRSYSILCTIQVALSGKEGYGSPTAIHTQTNSLETHTCSSYIVMLLTFLPHSIGSVLSTEGGSSAAMAGVLISYRPLPQASENLKLLSLNWLSLYLYIDYSPQKWVISTIYIA